MFAPALFTIVKMKEQLKCPSAGEWRSKMGYMHTMEYSSAFKGKEILIYNMDEAQGHFIK